MNSASEGNPFAPPTTDVELSSDEDYRDGLVMRQGLDMVIFNGAALPPRCFVTGRDTSESMMIHDSWHPRWLRGLVLFGVFPYFLVAPFLSTRVALRVPLSKKLLSYHLNVVRRGTRLIAIATVCFGAWLSFNLIAFTQVLLPLLFLSIIVGTVGFFMASRQPVGLNIVSLNSECLRLRNVHPACLKGLPELEN